MMIRKVSSLNKSYIQEYFPLMLFIMLYKVLVTFESQKHSGSPGGGGTPIYKLYGYVPL